MIVTLTPNPSLDRTIEVERLVRGSVIRALGGRVDPGGKGVNVSRALAGHGLRTTAVLPSGGSEGLQLTQLLAPLGVAVSIVRIAQAVRANVTVVEPDGVTTKLNEPGPRLAADEVDALVQATLALAEPGGWVVGCGSLPLGVDPDFYARLVAPVRERGARIAIDSSGEALRLAIAAQPDLVKPNREELAEASGIPVHTLGDAVTAAEKLRALGAAAVLASLGPDGAVLVDGAIGTASIGTASIGAAAMDGPSAVHGEARVARPRSTVGAGDAMLAGFLSCAGGGADALRAALAWGAAAAALPGSRMPTPRDVAAVAVTVHDRIDRTRTLEGDA